MAVLAEVTSTAGAVAETVLVEVTSEEARGGS